MHLFWFNSFICFINVGGQWRERILQIRMPSNRVARGYVYRLAFFSFSLSCETFNYPVDLVILLSCIKLFLFSSYAKHGYPVNLIITKDNYTWVQVLLNTFVQHWRFGLRTYQTYGHCIFINCTLQLKPTYNFSMNIGL